MNATASPQFKVGSTVFCPSFCFDKDGINVKRCEVRELRIGRIIPNYLDKFGLRYSAHPKGKPDSAMAYRPERLFMDREDAKQALRASVMQRIAILTEALGSIA